MMESSGEEEDEIVEPGIDALLGTNSDIDDMPEQAIKPSHLSLS